MRSTPCEHAEPGTRFPGTTWRQGGQVTTVDPFNIRALVPDFAAQMDGYLAASNETRARRCSQIDVQY